MKNDPTGIAPYLQLLISILVLLAVIIGLEFIFAPKADAQSVKARKNYNWNHPTFSKPDTVQNFKTGLLYSIVSAEYRPDKKQTFYIGVSLSHNDTVNWLPENSIRKVHLFWVENMGPYIKY